MKTTSIAAAGIAPARRPRLNGLTFALAALLAATIPVPHAALAQEPEPPAPNAPDPLTENGNLPGREVKEILVNVHPDGRIVVDSQPYDDAALQSRLQKIAGINPDVAVIVRGDRAPPTPYKRIVSLLDICKRAGVWNVSFMTVSADKAPLPVTITEDFEKGFDRWWPTAPENWKLSDDHGGKVLDLFDKTARTNPPHRSPFNFVLFEGTAFADVSITAKVRTTTKAYGHRDIVVVFGYQDPAHYYYAHFGEKADDHAGQIFIVNDAPRTKISTKETTGIPWKDDTWHIVRVTRTVADGLVRVFFDDMETSVLEAKDTTFGAGHIGFGSFDDTARFDDIVIVGTPVPAPAPAKK